MLGKVLGSSPRIPDPFKIDEPACSAVYPPFSRAERFRPSLHSALVVPNTRPILTNTSVQL